MLSLNDIEATATMLGRAIVDAMGTPENGRDYPATRLTLRTLHDIHRAPRVAYCGRVLRAHPKAVVRAVLRELWLLTGDPRYLNTLVDTWLDCIEYLPRDGSTPAAVRIHDWPPGIVKARKGGAA